MKRSALGIIAAAATGAVAGHASAQLTTVFEENFVIPAGVSGEDFTTAIGLEFVGNGGDPADMMGGEGGGYVDNTQAALVVQSYGSRQDDIGIASISLAGVTLMAGTEYTLRATVAQDLNFWSLGEEMFLGLNTSSNRPATTPFAQYVTDFAYNLVVLPVDDNGASGPFTTVTWEFTPAADLVDPLFVVGTGLNDLDIFIDVRARLYDIAITTGQDLTLPGCSLVDQAAPFGTVDFFDTLELLEQIDEGCP